MSSQERVSCAAQARPIAGRGPGSAVAVVPQASDAAHEMIARSCRAEL